MRAEVDIAVRRMKDRAEHIALERARLAGALAALRDLGGVTVALVALDAERTRFVARHAAEAAAEGWVA